MTELDRDALALIRAARDGDAPTPSQRDSVLLAFRRRQHEPESLESGLEGLRPSLRVARQRRRTLAWSLAALVLTGSLGAVASWSGVLRHWSFGAAPEATAPNAIEDPPTSPSSNSRRVARSAPGSTPSEPEAVPPEEVSLEAVPPEAVPPEAADWGSEPSPEPAPLEPQPVIPLRSLAERAPRLGVVVEGSRSASSVGPIDVRGSPLASDESDGLNAELRVIVRARDALARGDYAATLRWTQQHRESFSTGELVPERTAIEALVACRSRGDATLARSFLKRWPGSLFGPRLVRDCGLESNSVPGVEAAATQSIDAP